MLVLCAILKMHGHRHAGGVSDRADLAGRDILLPAQDFRTCSCHVDIDRIELQDPREWGRLVGRYKRALRYRRATNLAVNWRTNLRAGKINPRALQCGTLDTHFGSRLFRGGHSLIIGLLADRIDIGEALEPTCRFLRRHCRCLGPRKSGLRALDGSMILSGVDLVERLARLHLLTFCEETVLDEARNLRPDFCLRKWRGAPRQDAHAANRFRLRFHDLDARSLRLHLLSDRTGAGIVAATGTERQ